MCIRSQCLYEVEIEFGEAETKQGEFEEGGGTATSVKESYVNDIYG